MRPEFFTNQKGDEMKEWTCAPPKGKTVLIVEDLKIIAITTELDLIKEGYDVLVAGSGEEAVEIVKNYKKIDCVITDVDLGTGMNGFETAQRINGISGIPVIFYTGSSETDTPPCLPDNRLTVVLKNTPENVLIDVIKEKLA